MIGFVYAHWETISVGIFTVLELFMRKKPGAVPPSKWVPTILDQFIQDNQKGLK